jgi:lipid-A-disaccharide synthase
MAFHLIIQTNSPGELAAWVSPVLTRIKHHHPHVETWIFLTPCQYASGQEQAMAEILPSVTKVFSAAETLRHFLQPGIPLSPSLEDRKGAVLFLGGDPIYTKLLSFKYGLPAYGYAHNNRSLGWKITTLHQKEIGDLMGAAVQEFLDNDPKYPPNTVPRITFFSGSRPAHFSAYFPLLAKTLWLIYDKKPDLMLQIQLSRFIDPTMRHQLLNQNPLPPSAILTPASSGLSTMASSNLLVTVPGTNTAEAMYLGIPMIVSVPLNWPDLIIFDGLLGLLGKLPILGTLLKKGVIAILKRKKRFYALPNMKTNSAIVPEYVEVVTAETLAPRVLEKIADTQWQEETSKKLRAIDQPSWLPVDRLIQYLLFGSLIHEMKQNPK